MDKNDGKLAGNYFRYVMGYSISVKQRDFNFDSFVMENYFLL